MANFDDEELEELNYNDFKSQEDYQPSPAVEEELPTDTSQAEEKSPKARTYKHTNDVQVTVSDKSTPIVVLFGPPACGKTMTLIRLSRYLKTIQGGYRIEPVRSFRPSDDADYLSFKCAMSSQICSIRAKQQTPQTECLLCWLVFLAMWVSRFVKYWKLPASCTLTPPNPRDKTLFTLPRYTPCQTKKCGLSSWNPNGWTIQTETHTSIE